MDNLGRSRGLGGASPRRLYVIAIDAGSNTVAAGPDEALRGKSLLVSGMTLVSGGKLERPVRARVKIRYKHAEEKSIITPRGKSGRGSISIGPGGRSRRVKRSETRCSAAR